MNATVRLTILPPAAPAWVAAPEPPASFRRGYGLHDFEWPYKFYDDGGQNLPRVCKKNGQPKLHNGKPYGLPEVEKTGLAQRIKLYREREFLWYRMWEIRLAEQGSVLTEKEKFKEWEDAMDDSKAFTNKTGSRTCRSFVTGKNPTAAEMRKESVDCMGGLYRLAGDPVMKTGKKVYPIYTLDVTKELPTAEVLYPVRWLVHDALVCRPERIDETPTAQCPNGTFRVDPFPWKFIVPLFSDQGEQVDVDGFHCRIDFIEATRILELAPGDPVPNPFNPPR